MKYNIGDLFVGCNKGSVRYIDSIVETPQEAISYWYNMTHVDEIIECRYLDVTEFVIDTWIKKGSWEHYPVKRDNT
jgi:hypothetical protein